MTSPSAPSEGTRLAAPRAVHRAGESALLAEYPDTASVLAAAAAVQALDPPHLVDLVPAETTLLLSGTAARDLDSLRALLDHLPAPGEEQSAGTERSIGVVYDGEDLTEVAELLGLSPDALIAAHTGATWTAAFGGFAPGFAYLVPGDVPDASDVVSAQTDGSGSPGPPWDVPRRAEPRTAVPAGAVGLAARYCGIYPRSSPGGWQLIGRTEAELFDTARTPPALLTPGTRVRFTAQRAVSRLSATTSALARARSEAAAVPSRLARRRGARAVPLEDARPALEVLAPGQLLLLQDGGRAGQGAIGVSASGAFDRGALVRADVAVGNSPRAAVLESLWGPVRLRALVPTVVAVSGAPGTLTVHRTDPEVGELELEPAEAQDHAIALDPQDVLVIGPPAEGLRRLLAIRGGVRGVRRTTADPGPGASAGASTGASAESGAVLGSLSRDTLSGLGPAPLEAGDVLLIGPVHGLDAVPDRAPGPTGAERESEQEHASGADERSPSAEAPSLRIRVHAGPRDELLGSEALDALTSTQWTVRGDSDRIGVRLDGPALPVPEGAGSLPSEATVPGAIQVPPSGLPVVFGPDHPSTGGYPVLAVVTRAGLDLLAQAAPGSTVRFVPAD